MPKTEMETSLSSTLHPHSYQVPSKTMDTSMNSSQASEYEEAKSGISFVHINNLNCFVFNFSCLEEILSSLFVDFVLQYHFFMDVWLSPVTYRDALNWMLKLWANSNDNNVLLGCLIESRNISRPSKLNVESPSQFKRQ